MGGFILTKHRLILFSYLGYRFCKYFENFENLELRIIVLQLSQTEQVPSCPKGSIRLWDGYSMIANQIGNQIIPIDIGKSHCYSLISV